jgi:hypothetical protein
MSMLDIAAIPVLTSWHKLPADFAGNAEKNKKTKRQTC